MKKQTLVQGAAVLAAAAVASKLLGTLQKIPLQNVAGDEAFGIYSTVYPFYILVLFAATAGFPVAVSKFVAERKAAGDDAGAYRVLKAALWALTATGLAGFALLYFGAGAIAAWIGNAETVQAIRSVSFALLFVPAMAALRGYFQGQQNMVPTATSQVAEQFVRVAAMLALLFWLTGAGYGPATVAAGATFGSAAGALAGLLLMLRYWRKELRTPGASAGVSPDGGSLLGEMKRLLLYALPVCLGSIVVPILNIADSFTIPRLLVRDGFGELQAMAEMGVFSRGLVLSQLVAMIFSSVSVALVPSIAEAKLQGRLESIRARMLASLRFTWYVGVAASVGLSLTAIPVNRMLFEDAAGWGTMMIIGWSVAFSVINIVTASLLQGIGSVYGPALHLCVAAVVKVAGNVLLVPAFGIRGAALAGLAAFAVAAWLNWRMLRRQAELGIRRPFRLAGRTVLALAGMSAAVGAVLACGLLLKPLGLPPRVEAAVTVLPAIAAGVWAYCGLLFRTGALTAADLRLIPKLESRAVPLLRKWRWL